MASTSAVHCKITQEAFKSQIGRPSPVNKNLWGLVAAHLKSADSHLYGSIMSLISLNKYYFPHIEVIYDYGRKLGK